MHIANILLVGIQSPPLVSQLERYGYGVLSAADTQSIISIDAPYALMLISQHMVAGLASDAIERLYFVNNSAPIAVLIADPAHIDSSLQHIILNGTFEPVYEHEIASGFICTKIDRIFIAAQFNKNIKLHQRTFHEKELLKKELSLREQILKQERVINTNIIGSITSGIIILDNEGMIVLANQHVRELLGIDESIGAACTDVLPREATDIVAALKASSSASHPHIIDKRKIGARFIEIAAYRMLDYHNNPSGVLLMFGDITEQENISMQLYRAEKLATVGTMLSGIAHELRNPLAIISARAQRALQATGCDEDRIRKTFESIESQSQRCASIINSLLDFSRHTATKAGYHKISEVIDETLTYVNYQNVFDDIVVNKTYQPDLSVFGDRSRFVQVFLNLINNAAEAMDGRGTLTISTSAARPHHTMVEITDTGPGIPPENEMKIFDPFFTTKDPGKGTGLGLAIVYKIVQQSAGNIWFHSRPGCTSFFVKLPSMQEQKHG